MHKPGSSLSNESLGAEGFLRREGEGLGVSAPPT